MTQDIDPRALTYPMDVAYDGDIETIYEVTDHQNVDDPIEESDADIQAMQDNAGNDADDQSVIRNSSGALEFLVGIAEELTSYLSQDPGFKPRAKSGPAQVTKEAGSDTWRGRQAAIGVQPTLIAVKSDKRRSLTIINLGAGNVYLSSTSGGQVQTAVQRPNQFLLGKIDPTTGYYNPITLYTKDDVWASTDTAATVTFIEEFDL